jgi:two-component system, NarL family, sensor kinase
MSTDEGGKDGPSLTEIAIEIERLARDNTLLLERLSRTEQRFRGVSQRILRLQEAERGRLSRELHDSVGQSLTALKMQVELLARQAEKEQSGLAEPLGQLVTVAEAALQEVRQVSHMLRPQMLDDLGLVPTLQWLGRTWGKRMGLDVRVTYDGPEERVHADLETLVYRVVQEALTNAAKHSGAQAVDVELRRGPKRVTVEVRDAGRGFAGASDAPADTRGFGIRGLRDRVQLFGGVLVVDSAEGRGTVVRAEVPLPRGDEA